MEWVQALPPTLWHCVPALHFDNCTLIQMDIIGFSDIVMRLEVTKPLPLLTKPLPLIGFSDIVMRLEVTSSRRSITGMSTHIY